MVSITIRRLEDSIKRRLRIRAAHHGRSMEEEAREILKAALVGEETPQRNLADSIRNRFVPLGGLELPDPVREPIRRPPKLHK